MMDIYIKLAKFLDGLPGGFPSTETGVEIRILKKLFTPEEAELATKLSLIPEDAGAIAKRAKKDEKTTADLLEEMSQKGLLYRVEKEGHLPLYMATQYVIGIWEYHVNDLNPDLIRDMEEYIPTLFNVDTWKKAPQLRTVPVGRSIPVELDVMPYEKAEELIRSHNKFLVAPCICRKERTMVGEGCQKPEESCLVLGSATDYYLKNGLGRMIEKEEALEILQEADKHGLVLQPSNSQKIVNICCCCGCCCAVLRTIKNNPKPAELVSSAFTAAYDSELCTNCQVCVDRCQMDAIRITQDSVEYDFDRCIGCGLCVSTCPSEAVTLVRKQKSAQPHVPKTFMETYIRLLRVRKKLDPRQMARILSGLRSKKKKPERPKV
ncbi:MAG: 4Fe-4S dicluster domain-containing protein [Candidatus Aminicenantes bacterium]|nr:4Fe-4S dicluster domain-containing protein [Candidatus Aminicenantes bacterium]